MNADICCGVYCLPNTLNLKSVPILRFAARTVPSGLDIICRLAGSPTISWPSRVKATYEGNALPPTEVPSAACMIVGFPPIIAAAAELLVPRSIPIILLMLTFRLLYFFFIISVIFNYLSRYFNKTRSQNFVVQYVPLADFTYNGIFWFIRSI